MDLDLEKLGIMYNPPHVGEVLKEEYIVPLGLTITETALRLGVKRKSLSELVNGKSGISTKMSLKLAKAFNTTPQLWLNMQNQYDLWKTVQEYQAEDVEQLLA